MKMGRHWFALSVIALVCGGLVYRALDLHLFNSLFLLEQGNARHLRTIEVNAHRGMIVDRNGAPLAVTTPVAAIWINPAELNFDESGWAELGGLLQISQEEIKAKVSAAGHREFMYIKRQVEPEIGKNVAKLGLSGVHSQREYRRYYPMREVTSHLLGFTNIDDQGQEGLELAFNEVLSGIPGQQKIIKDRLGRWVEPVSELSPPSPGQDLRLSIDKRLQHLAYQELKSAVHHHQAKSGSLVLMDSKTGEVLAMANQPAFNPNLRQKTEIANFRNRAVTDLFEPGSTIKPFTLALAMGLGRYQPDSKIDTSPGYFSVGSYSVKDKHNYGQLSLQEIIQKSSNVGAAKIGLEFEAEQLWQIFDRVGFGLPTGSGFPGEAGGHLKPHWDWRPIDQATLSFGYGVSVTALQLARAYSVFANGGLLMPVTYSNVDQQNPPIGQRVLPEKVAAQVVEMLETVVSTLGTARRAAVPGYRVAGKTGTSHIAAGGGYDKARYVATFVGLVPVSAPRFVMVVTVSEPIAGQFYGGEVAAPVFSKFMTRALSILGVPQDELTVDPVPAKQSAPSGEDSRVTVLFEPRSLSLAGQGRAA